MKKKVGAPNGTKQRGFHDVTDEKCRAFLSADEDLISTVLLICIEPSHETKSLFSCWPLYRTMVGFGHQCTV